MPKCKGEIADLGERLEICRGAQNYRYEMREFPEAKSWGKICSRIEGDLKKTLVKCERK